MFSAASRDTVRPRNEKVLIPFGLTDLEPYLANG